MNRPTTTKSRSNAFETSSKLLGTVIRYEWRILTNDRIAQTVVLLFLVIVGCALASGFVINLRQQHLVDEASNEQSDLYDKTRREVEQVEQKRLAQGESLSSIKSGVQSPSSIYNKLTNFKATLPPGSLAMLNAGQSNVHPQTFAYKTGERFSPFYPTAGARGLSGLLAERSTDNPLLMLLGRFDLAFVLLYIYPLIILALSFNVITGGKEAGTLALELSHPIGFRTILAGKFAVRFLLLVTIGIVLPLMLALILTALFGKEPQSSRIFFSSALWASTTVLYGCFWFTLALLINAIGKSAAVNAVISVICWIAFAVLVPALVNLLIQLSLPSASSWVYVTAERKASLEINSQIDAANSSLNQFIRARYPIISGDKRSQERYDKAYYGESFELPVGGELLREFANKHPQWSQATTPNQISRALLELRRSRMAERLTPVLEQADTRRKEQETVLNTLRFSSPTILAQSVLNDVAESGKERHRHFLEQLDGYIRAHETFFTNKFLMNENIYASEFDHLRTFIYQDESLIEILRRGLAPVAALGIFSLSFGLLAAQLFKRYSVV